MRNCPVAVRSRIYPAARGRHSAAGLDRRRRLHRQFVEPTPLATAFGPEMTRSAVFFPAVAGLLALFLAASMPRWLRGLGFVALGAGLLAYAADRAGVAAAFNGQFDAFVRIGPDPLGGHRPGVRRRPRPGGLTPSLLLSLLAAVGGLAVLAWLVMPRGTSAGDAWLGLVSRDHADTIPIARGFLRNGEFTAGTHPMRYVWWNLYLVALVLFPLLCLRRPDAMGRVAAGIAADKAYGALVFVLLSLPLTAVTVAALGEQFKLDTPEGEAVVWQPAAGRRGELGPTVIPAAAAGRARPDRGVRSPQGGVGRAAAATAAICRGSRCVADPPPTHGRRCRCHRRLRSRGDPAASGW